MNVERIQTTNYQCIHCDHQTTAPKGQNVSVCHCGRRDFRATGQTTEFIGKITDKDNQDYLITYQIDNQKIQVKNIQTNTILAQLDPNDPLQTPLEIARVTDCQLDEAEQAITDLLNANSLNEEIQLEQTGNYYQLAEEYTKQKPVYYDETGLWWEWSHKEKRWIKTDETNILVRISDALPNPLLTLKSSKKHELLEALRRFGRAARPKEPPEHWVQYADKTYDLKTGETLESTPDYFNKNTIPWKIGFTTETPKLDELFKEWVVGEDQDETWVQTLHEIIAYSTLRTQPAQRIFAFIGAGANGKGTMLKIISKFLGHDNTVTSDLKSLTGNRFETANLYGKLASFLSEADEDSLKDENQLKRLTGDDLEMRYEFKNKGAFNAKSYATCLLVCNELPLPKHQSIAYYRRWLIVDFPHQFTLTRDILSEIPDSEYEALAAKCLEISKKLIETKSFTNEGSIEARTKRYDERANPAQHFINLHCVDDDPDASLPFSEFCNQFNEWQINRHQRKLDHRRVSAFVKALGYEVRKQNFEINQGTRSTRYEILGLRWTANSLRAQGKLVLEPGESDVF